MRPTFTPRPATPVSHLLALPLRPGEAVLLRDALAHELGDDTPLAADVARVVGRLDAALEDAVVAEPDPASSLPEHDLLSLPAAGVWCCGPGCAAVAAARADALARGWSQRRSWEAGLEAAGSLLAQAVLDGAAPTRTRALARLLVACAVERDQATA